MPKVAHRRHKVSPGGNRNPWTGSPEPPKPMALLQILEYPDPRLRKVAAPVAAVTPDVERLIRDMADTMYAAPGVGLRRRR